MNYHSLSNISDSKVIVRCDFDVPMDKQGNIESDYRIKRCIPTLKDLLSRNNKLLILTKLGRPENKEPELSTKNLLKSLKELLEVEVSFADNIHELEEKTVILFENTRFFEWEDIEYLKANPSEAQLIKEFISEFEYYVDEAFAMSHRKETSNFFIPKIIDNIAAGINYKKEIEELAKIRVGHFERPAYFVLGGAKSETKIPLLEGIIGHFDMFLLGGRMPKEILNAPQTLEKLQNRAYISPMQASGMDISEEAINEIVMRVKSAATIVWNGPLGKFESELYEKSTVSLIKALEDNDKAVKILGGGDTIAAVEKFGNFDRYEFISTGGGAMFSFLAKNETNLELLGMQF